MATSTQQQAALIAGVSSRTLSRWMEQPAFMAALADAKNTLTDELKRRIISLGTPALDTVERILESETADDRIKLSAARLIVLLITGQSDPDATEAIDTIRVIHEGGKHGGSDN